MSELDIFTKERKKWIQFDKDTEVLIKHIGKEELNAILKKARKEASMSGMDAGIVSNRRFGAAAVHGWRKIGEPEQPGIIVGGNPLPFTPENLAMLMAKSTKFSNFVNLSAVDAEEFLEGIEDTKNAS